MNLKTLFSLLAFTLLLGSCATAYKTGQTPDDVYSSPAPPADEYANVRKADDKRYRDYEAYDEQDDDYADYDDRYLRMKVRNRYLWSDLDDWYYYGNRYDFSYYNNWYYWNDPFYWNSPWSPVGYWNMYYNPYYPGWGWGGGFGLGYAWGWGGYYSPWYAGWYGGPGWGWGGWYDPWYTGWWGSPYYYGYGPGVIAGSRVNYQQRRTNLNTYNPSILNGNGRTGVQADAGRRILSNTNGVIRETSGGTTTIRRTTGNYGQTFSTYGVRTNGSVNTNPTNSSSQGRANAVRERFSQNNNFNSNRTVERYTPQDRSTNYNTEARSSTPSYSPPASSGSSSGGGGSRGGGSGRRF